MLVLICILGGFIAAVIAAAKNRNAIGWGLMGALLPLIAVLILIASPAIPPPEVGSGPA